MRGLSGALLFFLTSDLVGGPHLAALASPDRVRLDDVKVLTLYASKLTTGRRSAPLPQLSCQGWCGQWTPSTVQCYNMGSDGFDAAWKCEASMPEGYSFSSVQVGCEGYDRPDDPYILKDSCQLVFSLNMPRDAGNNRSWWQHNPEDSLGSRLINWAILGIVGYVIYVILRSPRASPTGGSSSPYRGTSDWGGGGGGGGGNNWGSHKTTRTTSNPQETAQGWYPWLVGGAVGTALGYALHPRERTGYNPAPQTWRRGRGGDGVNSGAGMGLQAGYGGTSRR